MVQCHTQLLNSGNSLNSTKVLLHVGKTQLKHQMIDNKFIWMVFREAIEFPQRPHFFFVVNCFLNVCKAIRKRHWASRMYHVSNNTLMSSNALRYRIFWHSYPNVKRGIFSSLRVAKCKGQHMPLSDVLVHYLDV